MTERTYMQTDRLADDRAENERAHKQGIVHKMCRRCTEESRVATCCATNQMSNSVHPRLFKWSQPRIHLFVCAVCRAPASVERLRQYETVSVIRVKINVDNTSTRRTWSTAMLLLLLSSFHFPVRFLVNSVLLLLNHLIGSACCCSGIFSRRRGERKPENEEHEDGGHSGA